MKRALQRTADAVQARKEELLNALAALETAAGKEGDLALKNDIGDLYLAVVRAGIGNTLKRHGLAK